MEQSEFLKVAIEAAKKAEEVIMHYYSDSIRVTLKPDQSPVTVADVESEKVIIETIRAALPDHGFLGEESGNENVDSEYVWIIDPIDGTKNYTRQVPIFGTQIALAHRGELILGVSNAPALHELMYAEKGSGAFLGDKQVYVSKTENLSDAWASSGGLKYYLGIGKEEGVGKLIRQTYRQRIFGDFWQHTLIAQGKFDIACEAYVKIWDVAAVTVIVREAGGMVTDLNGKEIDFNTTSFISTNGLLHNAVVDLFK